MAKSSASADSLFVIPSETIFDENQWKRLLAACRRGASSGEKREFERLALSKKLLSRKSKTGPRNSAGPDKARQLRQHYLWLFRELLDVEEPGVTDVQVCRQVILVIHHFTKLCSAGVFLPVEAVEQIRRYCIANSQNLESPEPPFFREMEKALKCPFDRAEIWDQLKVGDLRVEGAGKDVGSDLVGPLICQGMAFLLNMGASGSFQQIAPVRLRRSSAGRPAKDIQLSVTGSAITRESYSFPPTAREYPDGNPKQARQQRGSKAHGMSLHAAKSRSTPPMIDPKSSIPPSEEEILRKATARLLMIKQVMHSQWLLRLSQDTWQLVADVRQDRFCYPDEAFHWVISVIRNYGYRQVAQPWESPASPEMVGYYDNIPPLGLWESCPRVTKKDPR